VAEAERQKVELRERYSTISQKLESLLQLEQVEAQKSATQSTKLKAYKSKLRAYKEANNQLKEDLDSQRKLAQKYQKKVDMSMVQSFGLQQNPPTNLSLTRVLL
jgi:transcription-repair coupling factor (superfamily II helicase)